MPNDLQMCIKFDTKILYNIELHNLYIKLIQYIKIYPLIKKTYII